MKSIVSAVDVPLPRARELPELGLVALELLAGTPANDVPVHSRSVLRMAARAIDSRWVCLIRYASEAGAPARTRAVEPLAIVPGRRGPGLLAWCRLRRDLRTFLIDRIDDFAVTDERYEPHPDLALEQFIQRRRCRERQ